MRRIRGMRSTAFKAIIALGVLLLPGLMTHKIAAADDSCEGLTPSLVSVTPSTGSSEVAQDLLITGIHFRRPDGSANVTSVFAVEVGNPVNVVQSTSFTLISENLADVFFNFGSNNACKTFHIVANGPCGESVDAEAGAPVQFTCACPPPGQRIASLSDSVTALRVADVLTRAQAKPLTKRLNKAAGKLADGKERAAVNQLQIFVDAVTEMNGSGVLTPAQSQSLNDQATSIMAQISQ